MELTNRELYFKAKEEILNKKLEISDSEIYTLLIVVNKLGSFTDIINDFDKKCLNPQLFYSYLNEIIKGKPIQYVTHIAPFLDFDFYVDERVLIPRPETEGLALLVTNFIKENKIKHDRIFDCCTGSGCLAIYLKAMFEDSKIYASDISLDALEVAKVNANKYKADIHFLNGDKIKPFIEEDLLGDVLISNPPYVKNKEDIEEKVKKFEPMNAIYDETGVSFYLNFIENWDKYLKDNFMMAFEINYDQENELKEIINEYLDEKTNFHFYKDIYNLTRYLIIVRGYENVTF